MSFRIVAAILVAVVGAVGPALGLGLLFGFDQKISGTAAQGTTEILGLVGSLLLAFVFGLGASALMRGEDRQSYWPLFDALTKMASDSDDSERHDGSAEAPA